MTYSQLVKNRRPGDFIVSVSDGYVEWAFLIPIGDNHSIAQVEKAICKKFKVATKDEAIRSRPWRNLCNKAT